MQSGNEIRAINGNPGTGGEISTGITFDDVSKVLTIRVGWGSAFGFTNLTGAATAMHIHRANEPADFLNTAGGISIGLDSLPGYLVPSPATRVRGRLPVRVNLSALQETQLLAGEL
jgi:hypothetical protein